jgi:exodeoxyribonuclease VII large subunit
VAELDLFAAVEPASSEGAWTVAQVTARARQLVEAGFRALWVKGEVTNFKAYRSGHWYFTLRDAKAQIRCVMWRDDNRRAARPPEQGTQVFVQARPTVWEERGEFRLTVRQLIPTDTGGLWELQLQKAKAALEKDGLLDPARKRPLPLYPSCIAVVTSVDGAALRDLLSVFGRRWPAVNLLVVPTRVQGEGASAEICAALKTANRIPEIDLIIMGRGGGSREDLWAFNTEQVARAVAATGVPTISAVGHETDVALTDLVADLRAPTPSAAAEAAVPDRTEAARGLDALARGLGHSLISRTRLGRERLARTGDRMQAAMQATIERQRAALGQISVRLDALSPLEVLGRGYAVARDDSGAVLRSVSSFHTGMDFRLTVVDGDVDARVSGAGT